MRRGKLAQLSVEGLPGVPKSTGESELDTMQDTEMEGTRPRRNPGRRATSVEARRRKMNEGGEPKPIVIHPRRDSKEVDFGLDLFNPDEDT